MLRSKELAEELGVSTSTVRNYAREGLIPFVETPKGQRRFDREKVRAALSARPERRAFPKPGEGRRAGEGPSRSIQRTRNLRPGINMAAIKADAGRPATFEPMVIPVVGVPGSHRFLTSAGAHA